MSDKLLLTLAYEAENSQFKVAARNRTHRTLLVCVDQQRFQGRIVITSDGGKAIDYFDVDFLPVLMTGIPDAQLRALPPDEEITWTLPLSRVVDLHENRLDPNTLDGATIRADLDDIAVVPWNSRFYISSNAKQVSNMIAGPALASKTSVPRR